MQSSIDEAIVWLEKARNLSPRVAFTTLGSPPLIEPSDSEGFILVWSRDSRKAKAD
jgi:hypothetical protein